ncbi:MAG TPA: RNA polymerase-associated protein RapA [Candidatus Saccharimonadia bacterium]|nr:RNA polymerase-associated protein RapA [Candidatus Saccharimonadia bacterium]
MQRFAPGQRWISNAEPELGLGTVLRVDGRQVQVLYPATGVMRHYAAQSAPLSRAAFRPGDRITSHGVPLVVESVEEHDGALHYHGGGQTIPEGALDDVQNVSKADDRLITGRVDPNDAFELRVEALSRRAAARSSPGYGVLSARIDLIPHQLRAAEIASARRPPRVLLADEVGLGKTIEACLVVARLVASGRASRVLVLVPEALVYQWFVELLRRFNLSFAIFDEERVESIELEGDGRNPFQDEQLVLSDVGFLVEHPERARQCVQAGWDLLVVDEAHHLAWAPGDESDEYIVVEALAKRTRGVVLLTATPEQLGRTGHFARLRLLDPARFHDLVEYQHNAEHYVALSRLAERIIAREPLGSDLQSLLERLLGDEAESGAVALLARDDDASREELLRQLIDRHGTGRVMFRNRRAVVGGFPRRVKHLDVLPQGCADLSTRARLVDEFHGDLASPPFAPPLDLRADPRVDWLVALLDALPTEKVLLICRTQPKLHALEEALRMRSGVPVARFHEGLGIVQRDRNAAYFAQADGARVLLCTEIGSEGRNFQFAHHLVLWDLPLDPDLVEQRIGRLDRIGQSGDVHVHACVVEHSAQHALLRWFDEGLDAFTAGPEDGREILKRYGERVVDAALACARGEPDARSLLDAVIAQTRAAHVEHARSIAEGRDRLLELATLYAPGVGALRDAIEQADASRSDEEFTLRLLELYGVHVDELAPRTFLLDPEMATTEALPGFDGGARQVTFDRATALAREELALLRLDHPIAAGALDLLLSSETGNATFLVDDSLPPRTALLDAVFLLECVAPPALAIDRFLPPTSVRVCVDTRRVDRTGYQPDARSIARARERPVDLAKHRKIFGTLVPPMLAAAEQLAAGKARREIDAAIQKAGESLAAEIGRLRALARVNPTVRPEEIAAAEREWVQLSELLPQSRVRLESLRFVASADFLSLRG